MAYKGPNYRCPLLSHPYDEPLLQPRFGGHHAFAFQQEKESLQSGRSVQYSYTGNRAKNDGKNPSFGISHVVGRLGPGF